MVGGSLKIVSVIVFWVEVLSKIFGHFWEYRHSYVLECQINSVSKEFLSGSYVNAFVGGGGGGGGGGGVSDIWIECCSIIISVVDTIS